MSCPAIVRNTTFGKLHQIFCGVVDVPTSSDMRSRDVPDWLVSCGSTTHTQSASVDGLTSHLRPVLEELVLF